MLKKLRKFLQFEAIQPLVYLVNKPAGFSSFTIVDIFKKILDDKVGHAGTLDPLASGELLLLTGHTTKLTNTFITKPKQYQAIFVIGLHSDSYDLETPITLFEQYSTLNINTKIISKILTILKTPKPIKVSGYSAIKQAGTPLYLSKKSVYKEMTILNYKIISAQILNKDGVIKKILKLTSKIENNKILYFKISKEFDIKPRSQQIKLFENLLLKMNQNINILKNSTNVKDLFVIKTNLKVTKGTYVRSIAQELEKHLNIPTITLSIKRINSYK